MNDLAEMREVSLIVFGTDNSVSVTSPIDEVDVGYLAALIGANDVNDLDTFPMFNYYMGKAAVMIVNRKASIKDRNTVATNAYQREYELIHKKVPKSVVYGNAVIITGPVDVIEYFN